MSRTGRIVLPDYPHHVVHRGHNKQDVFRRQQDYERYLAALQEFRRRYGVKLYAYCLMTNHVHLLLEPSSPTGLAQLMKRVAGRYTRYYNRSAGRTGTLWEGRYRSSLVERESYLLACCRYIELNPVRAGLVAKPDLYIRGPVAANDSPALPAADSIRIHAISRWEPARMSAARTILPSWRRACRTARAGSSVNRYGVAIPRVDPGCPARFPR